MPRATLLTLNWSPKGQFWIQVACYAPAGARMTGLFELARMYPRNEETYEPDTTRFQWRLVLFGKTFYIRK
jgi:hypothetical protein